MPESMAVPLSADHMSIHNSFGISQNSGGDYSMAMAYLLAWQGPVSEEDDPMGTALRRTALHLSATSRRSGSCRNGITTR